MKKTNLLKLLSFFSVVLVFVVSSCTNEELVQAGLPDDEVFAESKIISFDEINQMTETIIDGEILVEDDEGEASKSFISSTISVERRIYDFFGEVTRGPSNGTELSGELNLKVTLYHAYFAILRGSLKLPDGTKVRVRGAWISDGYVYLIFRLSNSSLIYGYGKVDENGNIAGNFKLLTSDGTSRGEWTADLTSLITPNRNIVDYVTSDDRFTTLVAALSAADLVDPLNGEGQFTVFAPTNDAFAALDALPEGEILKNVLLYHVADKRFRTQKLLRLETITSLLGEDISVRLNEANEIVINDTVRLLQANIRTTNGIIHVIDAVLIPPSLQDLPSIVDIATGDENFSTLVGALTAADLVETLQGEGPFTVFAPINTAFEALDEIPEGDALREVLLYHVTNGKFTGADLVDKKTVTTIQGEDVSIEFKDGKVILNGSVEVIIADIMASNGIVHVVKDVLIPPSFIELPSIVDIATGDENFSTLVDALSAADLVETLQGEGPFTVFAPTNAAFEALDKLPDGETLREVLLYHVAAGKFTGAELLDKTTVTTVQGEEVTIELQGDKVILNGSVEVILADIMASNGIVHVIKDVLIPPSFTELPSIVDIATGDENFSILVDALIAADLVETLQGDGPFTVFAPTNAAFEALEQIPNGDALKQVLLYHVLNGKFTGADLLALEEVTTIQGEEIEIEYDDGKVILNDKVEVLVANIEASNGIVHVINAVLLPDDD